MASVQDEETGEEEGDGEEAGEEEEDEPRAYDKFSRQALKDEMRRRNTARGLKPGQEGYLVFCPHDRTLNKKELCQSLRDDDLRAVGDKIEVQWEDDEKWYLCVVAMGEDDSLVVELDDGGVFAFNPISDTWRWPQ